MIGRTGERGVGAADWDVLGLLVLAASSLRTAAVVHLLRVGSAGVGGADRPALICGGEIGTGRSVTRPEPWDNPDPEEFHFEPVECDERWKLHIGSPCRSMLPGHIICRAPSVAALNRGSKRVQWWAYCAEHMYGKWIEDGRVWEWRLVANEDRRKPVAEHANQIERFRKALMAAHAGDWTMEVISEAAHICAAALFEER